jgi:hypothetical protein
MTVSWRIVFAREVDAPFSSSLGMARMSAAETSARSAEGLAKAFRRLTGFRAANTCA